MCIWGKWRCSILSDFFLRDKNIDFIPFVCGGKDKVFELRELLKINYEEKLHNYLTAFFIDKDFDNYKGY